MSICASKRTRASPSPPARRRRLLLHGPQVVAERVRLPVHGGDPFLQGEELLLRALVRHARRDLVGPGIDLQVELDVGAAGVSHEEALLDYVGQEVPILMCPTAGAAGAVVYFGRAYSTNYKLLGGVGEVAPFEVSAEGSGRLVRGRMLTLGTVNATGNGSAVSYQAATTTQYVYGQLHVYSISGSGAAVTVKIQSDDNSGFTSATDRITFAAKSATGYEWATPVVGAITDTYWRATYTVSGSSPIIGLAVAVGIL